MKTTKFILLGTAAFTFLMFIIGVLVFVFPHEGFIFTLERFQTFFVGLLAGVVGVITVAVLFGTEVTKRDAERTRLSEKRDSATALIMKQLVAVKSFCEVTNKKITAGTFPFGFKPPGITLGFDVLSIQPKDRVYELEVLGRTCELLTVAYEIAEQELIGKSPSSEIFKNIAVQVTKRNDGVIKQVDAIIEEIGTTDGISLEAR